MSSLRWLPQGTRLGRSRSSIRFQGGDGLVAVPGDWWPKAELDRSAGAG